MVKCPIDTRLQPMYNKRVGDEVAVIPKLHIADLRRPQQPQPVVLGGVLIC